MLIFQKSKKGRRAFAQAPHIKTSAIDLPKHLLRKNALSLPEVSELQTVRHYTQLSQENYSIDTQFYPLGSCTMKYNPRSAHKIASLPGFLQRHPLARSEFSQGYLHCAYEFQEILKVVTGMQGVSLAPLAGAQGEFAGVAMIRAYHQSRGDQKRNEMLIPDAAHGTNPASAAMCGYKVREIPTDKNGNLDLAALKAAVSDSTAGLMLTNPSTLGVFESSILEISDIVHKAGGLMYYDGANLNAILGKVRPADMGFDVMHINLHKTFATPHGGGGPGAGPIAVNEKLLTFLPVPIVAKHNNDYVLLDEQQLPQTMGRLGAFSGNAGVILRAYIYALILGQEGMPRVAEFATLNANYLMHCLKEIGCILAYPKRKAAHEFIITFKKLKQTNGVTALDIAKRILDYGSYSPTVYFPLLVPECMLIEPTETECKEELDQFTAIIQKILHEIEREPEQVKQAPHRLPVRRVNEVKAARDLDLVYRPE